MAKIEAKISAIDIDIVESLVEALAIDYESLPKASKAAVSAVADKCDSLWYGPNDLPVGCTAFIDGEEIKNCTRVGRFFPWAESIDYETRVKTIYKGAHLAVIHKRKYIHEIIW